MTDNLLPSSCQNLREQVNIVLNLVQKHPSLQKQETTISQIEKIETSLKTAISPIFEIVLVGAFSAGKSTLINALLGRQLLYSGEGHATGTECRIAYALTPEDEKVEVSFLNTKEVQVKVNDLCESLGIKTGNITRESELTKLETALSNHENTGASDQSKALNKIIQGLKNNSQSILDQRSQPLTIKIKDGNWREAFNFANREEKGSLIKKMDYYCHHDLLQGGNVLVDLPGIDAPVKKDAELTYNKLKANDTAAVICVLKAALNGSLTEPEIKLIDTIKSNSRINDRVFYVFNRLDETWANEERRQKFEQLLTEQFQQVQRVYKTSAYYGFWGNLIRRENLRNTKFGLDSIFSEEIKIGKIPQFIIDFRSYCLRTELRKAGFTITSVSKNPLENYEKITNEYDDRIILQLVKDSHIEELQQAITSYLKEEKQQQLFAELAKDLKPLCAILKNHYEVKRQEIENLPQDIEGIKNQLREKLYQELERISNKFIEHVKSEVITVTSNQSPEFEAEFQQLGKEMQDCLMRLLDVKNFQIQNIYGQVLARYSGYGVAPILAIIVESFYYLVDSLTQLLIEQSKQLIANFFNRLVQRVLNSDYYLELVILLGSDAEIEKKIRSWEEQVQRFIESRSSEECAKYLREVPGFYEEKNFGNLREVLQPKNNINSSIISSENQEKNGTYPTVKYDCPTIDNSGVIINLLRSEFEPKVKHSVEIELRRFMNYALTESPSPSASKQPDSTLRLLPIEQTRHFLEEAISNRANDEQERHNLSKGEFQKNKESYNQAVNNINKCLQDLLLPSHYKLPALS